MSTVALTVLCRKCKTPLPREVKNTGHLMACSNCGEAFRLDLFPAIVSKEKTDGPKSITDIDQATCFNHETYQAESVCDSCGRFLCGLCRISFHGGTSCAACIQEMKSKDHQKIVNQETNWASIAVVTFVISIPMFIVSVFLIPLAIFLYIKKGRSKNRVLKPSLSETVFVSFVGLGAIVVNVLILLSIIGSGL